jgi:arylsulfatase
MPVIRGDDIGISNLSCYSDGLMGYRTPSIDRIANEGIRFTDCYGEQSCTAGRAARRRPASPSTRPSKR